MILIMELMFHEYINNLWKNFFYFILFLIFYMKYKNNFEEKHN